MAQVVYNLSHPRRGAISEFRHSVVDFIRGSNKLLAAKDFLFFPRHHLLMIIWLLASTPVHAAGLRQSGLGSSASRARHEPLLLAALHVLRRGCTTSAPGRSPGILLAPVHTCAQVSQTPEHLVALPPAQTRTRPCGRFAAPPLHEDIRCRG